MTKQEFDNTDFVAGMKFKKPDGQIVPLIGVDFDLAMFGTTQHHNIDLEWFGIDECELITKPIEP